METQTIRSRHIRFRPTRYGVLFILVLAAMILGSLNYNNNLGFMLSFLLGAMAAVSLLHTYKNLKDLHILSVSARPVFAGEIAVFELQLRADDLPRAAIYFSFYQGQATCRDIGADIIQRVPVRIAANKRGQFDPGMLSMDTHFPLGLFRCSAGVPLGTRCLVYPQPISKPFPAGQIHNSPEGEGGTEVSGVEDFQGLRPYQSGEPVEHIYWKAFSRGQGLQIKQFADPSGTSVFFDWYGIGGLDVEQKLSILCDNVLKAHRFNLTYGLKLPGTMISPGKGGPHRQVCLSALALFKLPVTER